MNGKKKLLILAAAGMLMLAFYQSQKTDDMLQQLQADGFVVDQQLNSTPRLVVDQNNRQLALVYSDRYVTYRFDQVIAVEERFEVHGDRSEALSLRLKLRDHLLPSVVIKTGRESDTLEWKRQLQGWLAH